MYSIPPEKKQQIKQIAQSGKMIEAIKEYRLLTNASLKDAKGAVEALMRGDYVDGPAPASPVGGVISGTPNPRSNVTRQGDRRN
ncbi:hypothetical protein [Candidatus Villigracilis affinis]|uniref:hypothetical protein n=1 Tax=Candidatus Villigracilis affinis TaxID=3140682 RepID=UPI001DB40BE1|nr:hypothetical protein [Anaerolineales bacterium]